MDYKEKVIALLKSQELSKEQKEKLEGIFPELKESKDEKVRKGIIELVRQSSEILEKKNQEQMLAWLEKQGEPKPIIKMKTPEESLCIDSETYNKIVDECVYGEQKPTDETPYPETLEKAIDLYYYSYGNGKGEFEHLSLEKFRDIVHTFVSDYGQKPAWSEEHELHELKNKEL